MAMSRLSIVRGMMSDMMSGDVEDRDMAVSSPDAQMGAFNDDFSEPLPRNHKFRVPEILNIRISIPPNNQANLQLKRCWATPT